MQTIKWQELNRTLGELSALIEQNKDLNDIIQALGIGWLYSDEQHQEEIRESLINIQGVLLTHLSQDFSNVYEFILKRQGGNDGKHN